MCAFDKVCGGAAVVFLAVFETGWITYTRGLYLALREEKSLLSPTHPLFLPYYPTVIGGQPIVALMFLHVALSSGYARTAIGVLSTVLNVVYYASVGYAMIASRFERLTVADNVAMFVGTVLMITSWSMAQILIAIHTPPPKNAKSLWCALNPSSGDTQCYPWRHVIYIKKIRFLSSLAVILSALGWMLSLGGIRNAVASVDGHRSMEWTVTYVPPVLHLAALLHAGCSGKISCLMQITSSILSTFLVVSMGYMVISGGVFLSCYPPVGISTQLLLIGGTASLFFWTVVQVLWPFYHSSREYCTVTAM